MYHSRPLALLRVNALSGLYIISTRDMSGLSRVSYNVCQCPLGLIHHFYSGKGLGKAQIYLVSMPSRAYTSFLRKESYNGEPVLAHRVNALSGLYIISTHILKRIWKMVKECQCPLGLIHHFYWG